MAIKKEVIGDATLICGDCEAAMAEMTENQFQLAIVDPPYGLCETLVTGGTWAVKYQKKGAAWDVAPKQSYFDLLEKVSTDRIIWGGNYFTGFIKPARGFICWLKPNMAGMHTMADCELALTSFDRNAKVINLSSQSKEERIHVTQKPVELYQRVLRDYAKTGDHILDTHGGSMSSVIACLNMGFKITCYEIDEDYFDSGCRRVEEAQKQLRLF